MKSQHEQLVNLSKMRLLRYVCGHTRKDKIRKKVLERKLEKHPWLKGDRTMFKVVWTCEKEMNRCSSNKGGFVGE